MSALILRFSTHINMIFRTSREFYQNIMITTKVRYLYIIIRLRGTTEDTDKKLLRPGNLLLREAPLGSHKHGNRHDTQM